MMVCYCINPKCKNESHALDHKYCFHCGTELLIKDQYRLIQPLQELNRLSVSETFLIKDMNNGIEKALKTTIKRRSPEQRLFERQVQILSALDHPGIPKIEESFILSIDNIELSCVVLEKIEGKNLQQLLEQRDKPIPQRIALQWLQQIVEILEIIHREGFCHRDIKPSNIMRRSTGELVLIDFGAVGHGENSGITQIGTPGYAPPEQLEGNAVLKSDFFALGCTFVYLLTMRTPYDLPRNDRNQLIWHEHLPKPISPSLEQLIDDLIAPNVDVRPRNTSDILQRLRKIPPNPIIDVPSIDIIDSQPNSKCSETQVSPSYNWFLPVSFFVGAIVIGVFVFIMSIRPRQQTASEGAVRVLPHTDAVNAIAFNPKGEYLATASSGGITKIWEVATGHEMEELPKHNGNVVATAFSPKTGKYIATAGLDGVALIKAFPKGRGSTIVQHQGGVVNIVFNPDETLLATASADGTSTLWNVVDGARAQDLNVSSQDDDLLGNGTYVRKIKFSREGKWVATASLDGKARLWRVSDGQEMAGLSPHKDSVLDIAFSPNSKKFVTVSLDGTAKLVQISQEGKISKLKVFKEDSGMRTISFSPDSQYIATVNAQGVLRLWDALKGSRFWSLNKNHVTAVAFSSDGKHLATGHSDNNRLILWERRENATYQQIACLQHQDRIVDVIFSPNSQYLATASWDNTSRLWKIEKAQEKSDCQ
jgi:WD40 repeat protein